MAKEANMREGICKYCGQSQIVAASTAEAANAIAEASCSCKEGAPARRISKARDLVDMMFSGFSAEAVDLIQDCIFAVNYGTIRSAALTLTGTTRVSIKLASEEKISITRTDTEVEKEEI